MIVYGPKSELKWIGYHKNTENPNKIFTIFFRKNWQFFTRLHSINCTNWERTGMIELDHLEQKGLSYFSSKGLDDICFGLEDMNLSRKNVKNFSTLHHLPSKCDISTNIAPNQTRPGPLETRHLDNSVHIKFKENRAQKGLQIVA